MKKQLLAAILTFTIIPLFALPLEKVELLARVNILYRNIYSAIKDLDARMSYTEQKCKSKKELDALCCIKNVWSDLLTILDPADIKLTILAQSLFEEQCQIQKSIDKGFNKKLKHRFNVYMTIVKAVCSADEYNKINNKKINSRLNDPQLKKLYRFVSLQQDDFFWKIGLTLYNKKLFTKLLSILEAEGEYLIMSLRIDHLIDENQINELQEE